MSVVEQDWERLAAELLRESRRKAGLSQRALAARAGVAQSEIARIETGRIQPSLPVIGRLLDAAGVHVEVHALLVDERLSATMIAASVSSELKAGEEERAFRTCLVLVDDLAAVTVPRLQELVADAPAATGEARYDALIAGIVEEACGRASIEAPSWVNDPWRTTSEWLVSGVPALEH